MVYVTPSLARLLGGCLLLSLTACGAPDSEKVRGQVPSGSRGETVGGPAATGALKRGADQQDRKAVSAGQSAADTDERDNRSVPGVPEMVIRDLGSVDPRDRYRALEHWNIKGGTTPLDPVFEAMEDEDEDVREKATAIVEKRWAEEQEKEQG
ncbi:MAG: hypothetical protein HP492_12425 [Nitrospira sp.]|nr:hypothetical protein [Nitrospira sp.]